MECKMSVAKKTAPAKAVAKAVNVGTDEIKSPEALPVPVSKAPEQKSTVVKKPAKMEGALDTDAVPAKPAVGKKPAAKIASKSTKTKVTGVDMTDLKVTNEVVESAVTASKETVESVVNASAKAASEGVEKAVAMGQEHVAAAVKAGSEVFENYEDVIAFNKDNFDAVVSANTSLVKGIQAFSKEFFSIAQASLEQNVEATQKIFSCTSVQEVVSMQNDLAKANYSSVLDKSRKLSDLGVKVAEDSTAPLAARVNVAVEKITKPLAA